MKQTRNAAIAASISRPCEVFAEPVTSGWECRPKLNGVFARWDSASQTLYSKRGIAFKQHLIPLIYAALEGTRLDLDGEIWAGDIPLQVICGMLNHERDEMAPDALKLNYVAFDAPDKSRMIPYKFRYSQVRESGVYNLDDLDNVTADNTDGHIYRYLNGVYIPGVNGNIRKLKSWRDMEVDVIGAELADPNSLMHGMLGGLLCRMENGVKFSVGSGFNIPERQEFIKDYPMRIKVKYLSLSTAGVPLNPVYIGLDL